VNTDKASPVKRVRTAYQTEQRTTRRKQLPIGKNIASRKPTASQPPRQTLVTGSSSEDTDGESRSEETNGTREHRTTRRLRRREPLPFLRKSGVARKGAPSRAPPVFEREVEDVADGESLMSYDSDEDFDEG
jgi:hypothetical protein